MITAASGCHLHYDSAYIVDLGSIHFVAVIGETQPIAHRKRWKF